METIPEDRVEITQNKHNELLQGPVVGKILSSDQSGNPVLVDKAVSVHDLEMVERVWRNSELNRSDIELNKVQDSDSKSLGSVSQWREYRKSLRNWPQSVDFPNKEKRPRSPDLIKE